MSFNYFPDLNRYFQSLYTRNQEWFRYRHHVTPAEQQRLFQAFLRMEEGLPVTIAGMRSNIRIPVFFVLRH